MGLRKYGNFKYKVIKRMRRRAITFMDEANTKEKREAWTDVVRWFDSFFKPKDRCLSSTGCICLTHKDKDVNKIDMMGEIKPELNKKHKCEIE